MGAYAPFPFHNATFNSKCNSHRIFSNVILEYAVSDIQDYHVFRLLKLVTSIFKGGNSGHISYIHYGKAGFSP